MSKSANTYFLVIVLFDLVLFCSPFFSISSSSLSKSRWSSYSKFTVSVEKRNETKIATFQQYIQWLLKAKQDRIDDKFSYRMLQENNKTRLQYWQIDGEDFPQLKQIALVVFGMMTSSPASELNFSTIGFIHSKLRNSLGKDRVDKLV